jgi:hypothetical protein
MHHFSYVECSGDDPMKPSNNSVSRRRLFAGAAGMGAIAATVSLIPAVPEPQQAALQPKEPPAAGGGYNLSEHVKRYYKTALV